MSGGLWTVPGLRGAAVRTGVKPSGAPDLALIVADEPRPAAGLFTTCAAAAAPVQVCREVLASHTHVRSIVVNSGNANALTGAPGDTHARQMVDAVEARCGGPALVLSTGVIGVPLPIDRVLGGIKEASRHLRDDAGAEVAEAILTTDTTSKQAAFTVDIEGRTFRIGGVAKGSGMIHPQMATMLAILATDAPIRPADLRPGVRLHDAADQID